MRTSILFVFSVFYLTSCIPLRIAPVVNDYRITQGKKFKRSLPNREMFIFEDPKEADEFYKYVNIKFNLNNENVYDDVPFELGERQFFFSFYEVEIPTKTLNLFPLVIDGLLLSAELGPVLNDLHESRKGHWYIAIETYSDLEKDCLQVNSLSRKAVLKYLRTLKKEYLSTELYNEITLKN
ncbi:MAG: hypothetical protein WBM53_08845 [Maribacter sp.]